ncbi:hypothetical protein HK102_006484 [Quaeritorhiza haematococci]|nr:hypothetical protein HK102_006484 [Quaeritorhiza haematococci]
MSQTPTQASPATLTTGPLISLDNNIRLLLLIKPVVTPGSKPAPYNPTLFDSIPFRLFESIHYATYDSVTAKMYHRKVRGLMKEIAGRQYQIQAQQQSQISTTISAAGSVGVNGSPSPHLSSPISNPSSPIQSTDAMLYPSLSSTATTSNSLLSSLTDRDNQHDEKHSGHGAASAAEQESAAVAAELCELQSELRRTQKEWNEGRWTRRALGYDV